MNNLLFVVQLNSLKYKLNIYTKKNSQHIVRARERERVGERVIEWEWERERERKPGDVLWEQFLCLKDNGKGHRYFASQTLKRKRGNQTFFLLFTVYEKTKQNKTKRTMKKKTKNAKILLNELRKEGWI